MIYLFVLGRVLLGLYFIMSGFNHFKNLKGMTGYAQSKGLPMPKEGVIVSGLAMFLGGFGILLGIYTNLAIYMLVLFLVLAAMTMHQYWKLEGMARMGEEINFHKNLALAGALLMLLSVPLPWVVSLVM